MDKLRFLTESRNGKKSVIEKLIHKDNSSSNRISCSIAEKSDIKSVMDICFARQQWMTEQGFNYVLNKDNRKYYRHKIEDRKLWVCKQSGVVMGFCVVEDHDINGYWKDFPTDSFVYAHDGMTRPHKSVKETSDYNFIDILLNAIIDFYGKGIRFDVLLPNQRLESFYEKELGCNPVKKVIDEDDGSWHLLMEKTNNNPSLTESFTKKISSKKNTDLISKPSFVLDNGVYIFHKTLGVKTVEGWNKKFNKGVVGVLLVEDEHQIVVALEDSPENLLWSKAKKLVNQPIGIDFEKAKSDFNGEKYCRNLNSPDFPAAYYCLNYKKGGRSWYLPSTGEMKMIFRHLEEIQNVLSIVGGQEFVTLNSLASYYWSSTETDAANAWCLRLYSGFFNSQVFKNIYRFKVRPISKFQPSELKESFTHKISHKKSNELLLHLITDGVFIFHQTLGLKTVEEWDRKDNLGVVGILVIQDGQQIVISLDEFLENFHWSKEKGLINKPIYGKSNAWSDFNGEEYCKELDSEDFPAAYQCIHYKSNYNWYLPSAGELGIIYQNLHDVQLALHMVGGCKIREGFYLSSSESDASNIWGFNTRFGEPNNFCDKIIDCGWVRPVFKFNSNFLKESFTKKISSKKNTDLISKPSFVLEDGAYILHETLGVRVVEGWNPKNNEGVVGVLVVEGDHKIIVALEDSPNDLIWSEEEKLVNQPVKNDEDAESDFNGEKYCRNLNSPDFPAAYYCLNYNKGGRDWYLPSSGELWMICKHLEEIQNVLSIVGGQKFVTTDDDDSGPWYWSSTETRKKFYTWVLRTDIRCLNSGGNKVDIGLKVRPISKFQPSELKESFTHKIRKTSNKDLVDIADKLATTNFDYNEENFKRKLRQETERYYESDFYKTFNYPLDYRHNEDIWAADEDGFHYMYLESTYWAERNETVDFEGYSNDVDANYAEPADVGVFVLGYGKDCVAYGEYNEYEKTHPLTESFTTKTKNKTIKDLQNKSDNVFNLESLLKEYVKSHCRPGSHNYDFYFSEENRPVFSDKEWKKLKGITVVKEIDDYYPPLHVVTPKGFTISDDFIPNTDDVFLFYVYRRRMLHIPVNRLPEKPLQELREWILNINESFSHKIKQKSTEDLRQKADESIGLQNLVKEIVLENDSFTKDTILTRTLGHRRPYCTHVLNKLRVRPTKDPTLTPYAIQGMVVLDESFYFKPEKYDISPLFAKTLKKKSMKELYNSDSIIVLNRIYTMEYRGKEFLHIEFNILRYNERYGRYTDVMNPQDVDFEFTELPKELQLDIYRFLRKKFIKK